MTPIHISPKFRDRAYYSAHFMDLSKWASCVQWVCQEHALPCRQVRAGSPGSFPTFICGDEEQLVVVKFFGPLFDGAAAFTIEGKLGRWLTSHPLPIPSPAILAEGTLGNDWRYLVIKYVEGVSIGEARGEISQDDLLQLAAGLGQSMDRLHTLTATNGASFPLELEPERKNFTRFVEAQRKLCAAHHRAWRDLPDTLLADLDRYVLPVDELIDPGTPLHLVHADLTADHLLVSQEQGNWHAKAIIDWGDARAGNILYELVALHLDLFRGDLQLLQVCMQAYQLPTFFRQDFATKALSMALLHQFPLPPWLSTFCQDARSLDELAESLYGI